MHNTTSPAPGGTPPPANAAPALSADQIGRMLLGLGLATWMEFYTFDAVNLVLPDMAGSFGISQDEASWILTTFSSALFFGVPISIWLAGRVGYYRYIIGSALLFVGASIGCGIAPDLEWMLVARAAQGLAGAGLSMWWRATVYLVVPRAQRGKSLMRISVMLYLSTAAALLFAGYITDHVSWRLIFVPNVVFAASAVWVLGRSFPEIKRPTDHRSNSIDGPGIALLGIALIAVQTILSRGDIDDWFGSMHIQLLAWVAAVALLAFVVWQLDPANRQPLLKFSLVRERHVVAAIGLGIFAGIILSGSIYALPEFLREVDVHELDATTTGQVMCVYAITAAVIRPLVTKSMGIFGQRKVLTFSLCTLVASMALLARLVTLNTPIFLYAIPLVMYAFCLAPLLSAVGGGTVARLPQEVQLDGVSIYMTFRQFGTSLGVMLVTVVLSRRESLHSSRLFEHLRMGGSALRQWTDTAAQAVIQHGGNSTVQSSLIAQRLLAESSAREAATLAYADAFTVMAVVGLVALCFVPLMPPTPVVKK